MTEGQRYEKMAEFIRQISRFTRDNECPTCGGWGFDENPGCPDHEPWEMPIDDAKDTINALTSRARLLVAQLKL